MCNEPYHVFLYNNPVRFCIFLPGLMKGIIMKKSVLLLSVVVFSFFSCDIFTPDKNSKTGSDKMRNTDSAALEALAPAPVSFDDSTWFTETANANASVIALSTLAQQKSTSERIINFATMIVDENEKEKEKLEQLSFIKKINLPVVTDETALEDWDELNKKSGKEFDEAYISYLLRLQSKVKDVFTNGSINLQDPDLKNFATVTLPHILALQDSIVAIEGNQ